MADSDIFESALHPPRFKRQSIRDIVQFSANYERQALVMGKSYGVRARAVSMMKHHLAFVSASRHKPVIMKVPP